MRCLARMVLQWLFLLRSRLLHRSEPMSARCAHSVHCAARCVARSTAPQTWISLRIVGVSRVNPAFFPMMPDCEFDSFLTIGLDGPALIPGTLSTVGMDLASWSESAGLNSENGAVRFLRLPPRARYLSCVLLLMPMLLLLRWCT